MNEKLGRLKRWKEGEKTNPLVLDINPTDRCNLNCKSCWQRNPKFKNLDSSYELSDKRLKEIVDEAIKMKVKKFEITGGGEPLMRKGVVLELMEKIKDSGKKGNITTNGTLFTEDDLEELINISWDMITFSLDGPNEEINNYLRSDGSFSSIKKSLEFLRKNNMEHKNPESKFNTVISNRNFESLGEIISLAGKYNVGVVSFETLTVHSDEGKKLKLSESERNKLKNEIPKIEDKAKKLGVETNIGKFREKYFENSNSMNKTMESGNNFSSIPCYEPWYHLVVKVDGSVQPCCLFDSKKENVKERSLKNIWFGKHFSKIRKNIREGNFLQYCKICNASQVIANKELRKRLKD